VFEADDGAAGIRLYRDRGPDLVITDIFMPERDGLATIVQLRREFTGVKIIVISGGDQSGSLDLREHAQPSGLPAPS